MRFYREVKVATKLTNSLINRPLIKLIDPLLYEVTFHFSKGHGELQLGLPTSSSHANHPFPIDLSAVVDPRQPPTCRNPQIRSSPRVQITSKPGSTCQALPSSQLHSGGNTTVSLQMDPHPARKGSVSHPCCLLIAAPSLWVRFLEPLHYILGARTLASELIPWSILSNFPHKKVFW